MRILTLPLTPQTSRIRSTWVSPSSERHEVDDLDLAVRRSRSGSRGFRSRRDNSATSARPGPPARSASVRARFAEQRRKHRFRIEARQAQPVDRAAARHQRGGVGVADDAVILDRRAHACRYAARSGVGNRRPSSGPILCGPAPRPAARSRSSGSARWRLANPPPRPARPPCGAGRSVFRLRPVSLGCLVFCPIGHRRGTSVLLGLERLEPARSKFDRRRDRDRSTAGCARNRPGRSASSDGMAAPCPPAYVRPARRADRASLHRHAEPVRRRHALAHPLDEAGIAGRRGHRRAPRRADDLHPLHPGATPGRAARVMAAILPALGRSDPRPDRPEAARAGAAAGPAGPAGGHDRQARLFPVQSSGRCGSSCGGAAPTRW